MLKQIITTTMLLVNTAMGNVSVDEEILKERTVVNDFVNLINYEINYDGKDSIERIDFINGHYYVMVKDGYNKVDGCDVTLSLNVKEVEELMGHVKAYYRVGMLEK